MSPRGEVDGPARTWHEVAVKVRRALQALDWPMVLCLPGEPLECGGTAAEHAAGYLGALRAVVEFKIEHLHAGAHGGQTMAEVVYESTRAELVALEAARPCGRAH